jgi:hypothetical protein
MSEKFDSFLQELPAKLDAVDKRLKELKVGAKNATEKAKSEAKAQLAALEARAKEHHAKVQAANAKAKEWLEEKKATTREKIAAWKEQRDIKLLGFYADRAEDYAVACMQLASASVDDHVEVALRIVRFQTVGSAMTHFKQELTRIQSASEFAAYD